MKKPPVFGAIQGFFKHVSGERSSLTVLGVVSHGQISVWLKKELSKSINPSWSTESFIKQSFWMDF